MKRFSAVIALLFAFVWGIGFAATPVVEPSLPSDIATYQKKQSAVCNTYLGKVIREFEYRQSTQDSLREIVVITLNGRKIAQSESSQVVESPVNFNSRITWNFTQYVKNSPEENWLAFTEKEGAGSLGRVLAEIGLTRTQMASACRK